jgi:hypothetical protein
VSRSATGTPARAITAGEVPLDQFSIAIDYFVGGNTKTSFQLWGVLNYNPETQTPGAVIPVTSIIEIDDLSELQPKNNDNYCDVFGFDIKLLHNGQEIANFPESYFFKGEEFAFYENPRSGNTLPGWWKNAQDMFDKYPTHGFASHMFDDFGVIPFDGIDLTRKFDLKFEWDISSIVEALKEAYNDTGDYNAVADRSKTHFQDFFKSFALKVTYKD